jgi:hypothetical protein
LKRRRQRGRKKTKKASVPKKKTSRSRPQRSQKQRIELEDIVDLDTIGPDPSTGRDNEIYGKSTEIELEILKALCPKGVTPEVGDELMEAAVDVCSLPGKLATSEIAQWDQMGATLSDLSSQLQRRRNAHPRDTQWRTNNKNALGRIRTLEDLLRVAKEVGTQRRKVYSNMQSRMLDTLYHAG